MTAPNEDMRVAFRFHARALAALGKDLVTDDVVALMELVKNAYDALATHVTVRIHSGGNGSEAPYIEIDDDGHGMDETTIRDVWFVIATPSKQQNPVLTIGKRSRAVTGEKGLGRLSAARLGRNLDVITKAEGKPVLRFSLNWEKLLEAERLDDAAFDVFLLPTDAFVRDHGTRIRIGELNSVWTNKKIEDLREKLARLVSPFAPVEDFLLRLDAPENGGKSDLQHITHPKFMSQPKYAIQGGVDADGTIRCRYRYRPIDGSNGRECELSEEWAAIRKSLVQSERANLSEISLGCGPFQFEIRAWDLTQDDTRDIFEHFGDTRSYIRGAIKSQQGVSIYRDDILVLPKSDDTRDWLGLDLRRVSRVGSRLSTSKVVGCVRITKSANPKIVDTSDREGLVSNPATIAFRHLVTRVVTLLEHERDIDRMGTGDTGTARDLFASLNAKPLVGKLEMLRDSGADMGDAVKAARDFGNQLDQSRATIEKRFGYYNRLAVIGTIAQMVIHEIRNRTTVIGRGLRKAGELAGGLRDTVSRKAVQMAKESVTDLETLADRFAPLASRGYRAGRRTSIVEESIDRCLAMQASEVRSSQVIVDGPADTRTAVRSRSCGARRDHS